MYVGPSSSIITRSFSGEIPRVISFLEMTFIAVALGLLHNQRKSIGLAPLYLALGMLFFFAQIVGGTVESAQGATVAEQSITWTAADTTDPGQSRS